MAAIFSKILTFALKAQLLPLQTNTASRFCEVSLASFIFEKMSARHPLVYLSVQCSLGLCRSFSQVKGVPRGVGRQPAAWTALWAAEASGRTPRPVRTESQGISSRGES